LKTYAKKHGVILNTIVQKNRYLQYIILKMPENTTIFQIDELSQFQLHGINKRKIAFVVFQNQYAEQAALLHKIIGAVGLDLEQDVAIFQVASDKGRVILNELHSQSAFKHVFIFGFSKHQVSLQSDYHPLHPLITERFVIHPCFSLIELAVETDKKKLLWTYLKKIFK